MLPDGDGCPAFIRIADILAPSEAEEISTPHSLLFDKCVVPTMCFFSSEKEMTTFHFSYCHDGMDAGRNHHLRRQKGTSNMETSAPILALRVITSTPISSSHPPSSNVIICFQMVSFDIDLHHMLSLRRLQLQAKCGSR